MKNSKRPIILSVLMILAVLCVGTGLMINSGSREVIEKDSNSYQAASTKNISISTSTKSNTTTKSNSAKKSNTTASTDKLTEDDSIQLGRYALYEFGKSRTVGCSDIPDDTVDFEAIAGINLKTSGTTLTYSIYNHIPSYEFKSITLYSVNTDSSNSFTKKRTLTIPEIKDGKSQSSDVKISLSSLSDGLYKIDMSILKLDDKSTTATAWLYVKNKTIYVCRATTNFTAATITARKEKWDKATKDLDPKDYLSTDEITYPTSGTGNHVVDTQKWIDLSKTIIGDFDWTDEMKVYAFIRYLANNYAYDKYRTETLCMSRAKYYNAYDDESMFMYTNKVGVCWDFTNALAIMCRANGIACTSVENSKHTWNAVYLNGKWISMDLCELVYKACTEKDTDSSKWSSYYGLQHKWKEYYGCYYGYEIDSTSEQIWTKITATK